MSQREPLGDVKNRPKAYIKGRRPKYQQQKVEWRQPNIDYDEENKENFNRGGISHGVVAKKTTSSLNLRAYDFSAPSSSSAIAGASGALFVAPVETTLLPPPPLSSLETLNTEAWFPILQDSLYENVLVTEEAAGTAAILAESNELKAVVEEPGYIAFRLRGGIQVNIGPNYAVQVINSYKQIRLALSSCATQMALVHPQGRMLQYNSRIEIHSRVFQAVEKNAKIWPRGISFTSNNCAIVYLVDQAGTRSTSDSFHNLYFEDITETIFSMSCEMYKAGGLNKNLSAVDRSIRMLNEVDYWQSEGADFWRIDDKCIIQQTFDGYVSVERKHGNELFSLKTSPGNGKARLQSSFIYVTASTGNEAHLFVKSKDRRIHHSTKAFVVRNAGHSAGFDEKGELRIF